MQRFKHYINGQFEDGERHFESVNPATGKVWALFPEATEADVNRAVDSAENALHNSEWSRMTATQRGKMLRRLADLISEHATELGDLETIDSGKLAKETRGQTGYVSDYYLYYAGLADKIQGDVIPIDKPNFHVFTTREPIGVVAAVVPWNAQMFLAATKIAPALAAGNTVVLKSAETTPLTAMKFAELCQQAGLPAGVVNIVNGAGATGAALVNHPDVDKVAFTGSTEVGKLIRRNLAGTSKRLTLELGGKGANIIFEDAALDQAVEGIVSGIFFNQGHVCCAGSRLLIQESVADVVIDKLKRRMATLRVGNPMDKNTDLGAINSAEQLAKITELVDWGQQEGAQMWHADCQLPTQGYFFRPTIFTQVAQSHRIAQEEIFGPVLSVMTFRTPAEALQKANNTPYGLSAGIWSDKGSKLFKIAGAIRAGVIWGNTFNKFDPAAPFGGYKESGFGREGGLQGLLPYVVL